MSLCLTTMHLPLSDDTLPAPIVVATITTDPRVLRNADPARMLASIASKLGLMQYTVVSTDEVMMPGVQLELFRR